MKKIRGPFLQNAKIRRKTQMFTDSTELGARLGVIRQHSVLRRVLRRFWEGFRGRVLGRVLRRGPAMAFTVNKGSEKGSQKGF